jgi:hypothetical protein
MIKYSFQLLTIIRKLLTKKSHYPNPLFHYLCFQMVPPHQRGEQRLQEPPGRPGPRLFVRARRWRRRRRQGRLLRVRRRRPERPPPRRYQARIGLVRGRPRVGRGSGCVGRRKWEAHREVALLPRDDCVWRVQVGRGWRRGQHDSRQDGYVTRRI